MRKIPGKIMMMIVMVMNRIDNAAVADIMMMLTNKQ